MARNSEMFILSATTLSCFGITRALAVNIGYNNNYFYMLWNKETFKPGVARSRWILNFEALTGQTQTCNRRPRSLFLSWG